MTERAMSWVGRALSGIAIAFLLFDGIGKVARVPQVVAATIELGYPDGSLVTIGALVLLCTLVYACPRTSVVGAVLLTGFLGGAVATNLRVGNPTFTHVLFPVYLGGFVWTGLLLRIASARALLVSTLTRRAEAQPSRR